MTNPYIRFDLEKLKTNIIAIKSSCPGVKFLFPVKCCSNPKVLDIAFNFMDGFDVSNIREYQKIAKNENITRGTKIISSSGPLSFQNIGIKNVYLAVNSLSRYKNGCGLRINFNFDNKFIQSHFGEDLFDVDDNFAKNISYVHFHIADARTRDLNNCILKNISLILKKFTNIQTLNIGGNLENLNQQEAIEYINNVRKMVPEYINIFVEVGDLLFTDCGTLYCGLIDCKKIGNKQIAILNVSKLANLRWSRLHYKEENTQTIETEFYGCNCCEDDVICSSRCHALQQNEQIIFTNISPYSYEWNNSFNGIPKIKIIFD